jgi:hypothetical protein
VCTVAAEAKPATAISKPITSQFRRLHGRVFNRSPSSIYREHVLREPAVHSRHRP